MAAYGPDSHSSPRSGCPGGRPFDTDAASAHSAATADVATRTRCSSVRRCARVSALQARCPARRAVIAASSWSRTSSARAGAAGDRFAVLGASAVTAFSFEAVVALARGPPAYDRMRRGSRKRATRCRALSPSSVRSGRARAASTRRRRSTARRGETRPGTRRRGCSCGRRSRGRRPRRRVGHQSTYVYSTPSSSSCFFVRMQSRHQSAPNIVIGVFSEVMIPGYARRRGPRPG